MKHPRTQKYLQDEMDIKYQLVPPHIHHRNAAERAIRTFKNHFIAGLCITNPHFPLHLWCRLVRQAEETLNMLRTSASIQNCQPTTTSLAYMTSTRIPMAPPGIKVIAHENQPNALLGPHTGSMVGTLVPHTNTIAATVSMQQKQELNAFVTQWNSSHTTFACQNNHPPMLPFEQPKNSSMHLNTQNQPHHSRETEQ
jgi:hypothetical protein